MTDVYGYCPRCGGLGMSRERRLNGNDRCESGHMYPSSLAVANPLLPVAPERTADIAALIAEVEAARTEAATMRTWAEEAAAAENENAEDAKRERAAVVAYLTGANAARCRSISDEVAMRIERGEHRREEK